jgi:uncharacterized protein with ParB-like and HNH nuclease domain
MASSSLQTLSAIFNDKSFRVPDYQRGYSWEKEHRDDFWQDLNNLDDDGVHYMGMIAVERKDDIYYIVDGQQRVATVMILLKILLDRFDDEEYIGKDFQKSDLVKKYLYKRSRENEQNAIFGYEKDNPSDIYYRKHILKLKVADYKSEEIDTLYTQNLKNAFDEFEKKVKNSPSEDSVKLINKITKQLKFNFYEIETNEGLDEFIIFETMNNRGKQLTTLELLKNRLIYLTTLLKTDSKDESDKLRADISEVWKTIYEYIGKDKSGEIEDDRFLKDHWIMYFDGAYNKGVANPEREYLLRKCFIVKRINNDPFIDNNISYKHKVRDEKKVIIDKIRKMDQMSKNYKAEFLKWQEQYKELSEREELAEIIDKEFLEYDDIKNYIYSLQKTIVSYYKMFNPLQSDYGDDVQKWLLKLNRLPYATFRPLLMCVLADYDDIDSNKIVELLKLMEKYIFVKLRMSKGNSNIVEGFYDLANTYRKKQSIDNVIEYLRNYQEKDKKFKNILEGIIVYEKDKNNGKGWYSWEGLTYLLYEYELYLQEERKGEEKLKWQDVKSKNNKIDSTECIYPQDPTKSEWEEFDRLDEDKQYRLLHSLGNLLLLSQQDNRAVSNKKFTDKKEIYRTANYNAIKVSQYDNWTPTHIIKRGEEILEFAQKRWEIEISKETINDII